MAESPSLSSAEATAREDLRDILEQPQRIAYTTHIAIGTVSLAILGAVSPPLSPAAVASARLLNRASNDLRAASILAQFGYVAQVASLLASLVEAMLAAAYIGRDETLAREWLNHDDAKNPFRPAKVLAEALASAYPVGRAGDPYELYRQLCVPKHVNPIFETRYGVTLVDGVPLLVNGPDTTPFSARTTWLVLVRACQTVAMALGRTADLWLGATATATAGPQVAEILERGEASYEEFKRRWPD